MGLIRATTLYLTQEESTDIDTQSKATVLGRATYMRVLYMSVKDREDEILSKIDLATRTLEDSAVSTRVRLFVRMSEDEKETLRKNAESAGVSEGLYLRAAYLLAQE